MPFTLKNKDTSLLTTQCKKKQINNWKTDIPKDKLTHAHSRCSIISKSRMACLASSPMGVALIGPQSVDTVLAIFTVMFVLTAFINI